MDARGPLAFHGELQQNTSMPTSITVRDVPDETRNELAARAARTGRSLQEYLRSELIELARRPDPAALMERVAARVRRMGTSLEPSEVVDMLAPERR
jgi:antitoxin FitA